MDDPIESLAEIGRLIISQDNLYTAEPIFLVQRRRRIYGFDSRHIDDYVWLYPYAAIEVDQDTAKRCDEDPAFAAAGEYSKVYFVDEWEFVQPFFTRQAAETYMQVNKHNLGEARIYVDSGHRNQEWKAIRKFLAESAGRPSRSAA